MIQIDATIPTNCVECDKRRIRWVANCYLIFDGCANCGRHPNCPLKEVPSGKCKNCEHYRNGICIWHSGFRPLEDWYCADFMMVEEQQDG